ncbi:MAG: hypothetical protein ACKVQU_01305 [Burkholderiales bacterium]
MSLQGLTISLVCARPLACLPSRHDHILAGARPIAHHHLIAGIGHVDRGGLACERETGELQAVALIGIELKELIALSEKAQTG